MVISLIIHWSIELYAHVLMVKSDDVLPTSAPSVASQPAAALAGPFGGHGWLSQQECHKWVVETIQNWWFIVGFTTEILQYSNDSDWLVVLTILKNISQWEGLSHILWKIKNFETTNQMMILKIIMSTATAAAATATATTTTVTIQIAISPPPPPPLLGLLAVGRSIQVEELRRQIALAKPKAPSRNRMNIAYRVLYTCIQCMICGVP